MIVVLLWMSGTVALAQPNAFFTASTNGTKSLEAYFTSTYSLDDTLNYQFLWDFGDGSTGDLPLISHLYQAAGTYQVSLTIWNGTDNDTFSVGVTVNDELSIPNVFTPNQDGINDFFIIRTNGIKAYSFTIFTRSGYQITTIKGTSIVWDGKMASGKLASPGLYYYTLSDEYGFVTKGFFYLFY